MLPTSHPVPTNSAAELALAQRATLANAFEDFSAAASQLEGSYRELREEATRLRATLAERNRALRNSLAENANSKHTLRRIVDALPCGVLVLDEGYAIELINPEARRLLDVGDEHVSSLNDLPSTCQSPIRTSLQTLTPECGEDEFCASGPSGARWLAVRLRSLRQVQEDEAPAALASDRTQRRAVLILRDTTEQKRLEAEREAARNVVALAEMSTVLAHEIRNPLASLELFASLIAKQSSAADECVSHIQAGIRSLSSTVNNVLLFHGGCTLQRARILLAETLISTIEFMRPLADQNSIGLSLDERSEDAFVLGDENALRQVFLNLASNAFHHTPTGGSLRVFSKQVDRSGARRVLIEFCDNGSGIDPEALPRIFEPGFSAGGQTPGLGLTICRRIIEQHSGTLDVRSEVGRGTTFSIEIPLA